MTHILTLIAARDATTLDTDIIAQIRQAVGGGPPDVLSPGEAVDIACPEAPDLERVRTVLGARAIDAVATAGKNRRKRLLVADMDSTIVAAETLDELAAYAGLKEPIAAITRR